MLSDYYRVIISRWRLSNHRLNIETGRYTRPMTERSKRVCTMCDVVEDEQHVIYECPRYGEIRNNYEHLTNGGDISNFLNPEYGNMMDTAKFIYDIESKRDDLKLWLRCLSLFFVWRPSLSFETFLLFLPLTLISNFGFDTISSYLNILWLVLNSGTRREVGAGWGEGVMEGKEGKERGGVVIEHLIDTFFWS